jgi:hypothetical protein
MMRLTETRPARLRPRSMAWLAASIGLACSAPVSAQYGQPTAPRQDVPSADAGRRDAPQPASQAEVLRAAACLVGRDAAAAAALLATGPYSRGERQEAVRTLRAAGRCLRLRDGLATSPLLLRGALAESLYEAQFAQPPAAATALLDGAAAAEHADVAPAFSLAQCAAAQQPALVRSLLAADPESAAEGQALQALNPVFSQCVTAGTRVNVDRGSIRALLAESLYRWAVVQRDGASSPWAAAAPAN